MLNQIQTFSAHHHSNYTLHSIFLLDNIGGVNTLNQFIKFTLNSEAKNIYEKKLAKYDIQKNVYITPFF